MADDVKKLEEKIRILEDAKSKLSREWLSVEREKSKLAAAVDNLGVGFIILDDYNKITHINGAAEEILNSSKSGELTFENIQKEVEAEYDLTKDITTCKQERIQLGPKDVRFGSKSIRIFISPIIILKKSITVPGTVLLIEDITQDEKSWINKPQKSQS